MVNVKKIQTFATNFELFATRKTLNTEYSCVLSIHVYCVFMCTEYSYGKW